MNIYTKSALTMLYQIDVKASMSLKAFPTFNVLIYFNFCSYLFTISPPEIITNGSHISLLHEKRNEAKM